MSNGYYGEPQMPPEIKKIIEKAKKFFGAHKGKGSGLGFMIVLILVAVLAAFTSFYTIDPDEAGVVLRFGRYIDTTKPGLHLKIPFGIDQVYKVQLTTIRKEEFGFRTKQAGVMSRYTKSNDYNDESLMLTGDLNVADVEWIVQFKVNDPKKFLFNVRNVKKNLRDVSESITRMVVGDASVNDVLTVGRVAIADEVKRRMQDIYNYYDMGITVTNVILQDVNPPDKVKPSFNEVNAAKQEQEKMVNQAWAEYNRAIPEAKGKAEQTIAVAEGYAQQRINNAEGEANRFRAMHREYVRAPEVTKTRLYLEKMEAVMGRSENIYIMDPQAKTLLPFMNLKDFGGVKPREGGAQ